MHLYGGGGEEETVPENEAADRPTPSPSPTASPTPSPTPVPSPVPDAAEIGDLVLSGGEQSLKGLLDRRRETYVTLSGGSEVTVESAAPIGSLYLTWRTDPGPYAVTAGGESMDAGEYGFLNEFVRLPAPTHKVTLTLGGTAKLSGLRAFTPGAPPDDVQIWEPPGTGGTDVLVFPTHADDDVIFFGGLIAQSVDRGLDVQVCYLCDHSFTHLERCFELLDGLWALGVRRYPVTGPFPDKTADSFEEAAGRFGEEKVVDWQVEQLRRFRPLVAVGHDRRGEYGHGAHMLNGRCLEKAAALAADAGAYPESAERYGAWDTPKLYLHYAEENPIVLELETPLENFGGRTAFQVASDAMLCHQTQLQYGMYPQLENRGQPRYNCRQFGLVRSAVGVDTGNDIMEHTGVALEEERADIETHPIEEIGNPAWPKPLPALTGGYRMESPI